MQALIIYVTACTLGAISGTHTHSDDFPLAVSFHLSPRCRFCGHAAYTPDSKAGMRHVQCSRVDERSKVHSRLPKYTHAQVGLSPQWHEVSNFQSSLSPRHSRATRDINWKAHVANRIPHLPNDILQSES